MGAHHGSDDGFAFLFALFFFGIIISVLIWDYKKEQKRKKEISDYCDRNNLEYSETALNIPDSAYGFSLIKERGHTNLWENEMSGTRGDYSFTIFEHHSVSGYGKNRSEIINTICILLKDRVNLPQFFVRDENMILDSLGKLFGGQDINFDEDPEFSKMFVLQGMVEQDVRDFFDRKIRRVFVTKHVRGYKYEGKADCFMVSLSGRHDIRERLGLLSVSMGIFKEIIPREEENELLGNVY